MFSSTRHPSDLRQMNVSLFPKSPLTLIKKRRRKVRFDNKITTHPPPPIEIQATAWVSTKDYLERQIKECRLLRSKETAKTYLEECELIKKQLRQQAKSTEERPNNKLALSSNHYPVSNNNEVGLETYISEMLLEGLRLSNYRGLESGSYSQRRDRTPAIVKSVVSHYQQSKRRHSFLLNKSKMYEEVSMFAHQQSLPDQHWARVLALVDERIVER